jgi:hydroxymethylpyrimidine pyrophosphatase-like HAD family hydrolase
MKPKCILVDLDGTLAKLNGRDHYDASTCKDDSVNIVLWDTLKLFLQEGCRLIILSGRSEKFRLETIEWLHDKNIYYNGLYMRSAQDSEISGIEFKRNIYLNVIDPEFRVILAFEDDWRVADMYRSYGIECWLVDKMEFLKK